MTAARRAVVAGLVALVGLVALATGCSDPAGFQLKLTWSDGPVQVCPQLDVEQLPRGFAAERRTCAAIAMTCDAHVQIRVVSTDGETEYFNQCLPLPAGGDLCGLAELALPGDVEIPNTMVRIQVVVWSDDVLAARGANLAADPCPIETDFDRVGRPVLKPPVPAVGGEIYFAVGERALAELSLSCADHDQLNTAVCRNRSITLDANVVELDPDLLRSVSSAEADGLEVAIGEPRITTAAGYNLSELVPLERATDQASDPHWVAAVPGPITGVRCVRVRDPQLRAVVTCVEADTMETARLPLTAVRIDPTQGVRIIELADRLGAEQFGPIVFGVVVDRAGRPIAGADVTALITAGPPARFGTVVYPNASFDDFATDVTGANGTFLSIDAAYDTTWRAAAPGLVDDGKANGGLILNAITAVVIRMQPGLTP